MEGTSRVTLAVFKDTTGRGIFGSRSVIRPSHEFVRRCFFTREFRADTNTFNQPSHPSQLVGDAFLSLPRAGGSLARLPTLVTKTNGMYLFHGTPASGFLLSPLCIALVKHFFLSSSLSRRLSSSFFFSPSPLSHRSVVLPSSIFPFRPSRAFSLHSRSYSPFPDLSRRAALLEASARGRFARENGPHTAETTRRNRRRENRRSNERIRYCAHIERELPRTGQTWKVRIEKDTTPLVRDKSRNGEGSRMRRSVESCCQAGYKFQVKF